MTVDELQKILLDYQQQLLKAKKLKDKRKLKKLIKDIEQQIKQTHRADRVDGRQDVRSEKQGWKQTLADKGIDPNASISSAVSSGIGSVASVFNKAGDVAISKDSVQKTRIRNSTTRDIFGGLSESPMLIVGIVGAVIAVIVFIFKRKK